MCVHNHVCIAWETQQGSYCFLYRAIEGGGVGMWRGKAVITNSIHLKNNNTALSVNHDLFSSGSYWSAPAKISTHLPSLAVTSQDRAPAWPPAAALSVSFALCTQENSRSCTCMWDSELLGGGRTVSIWKRQIQSEWGYTAGYFVRFYSLESSFLPFNTIVSTVKTPEIHYHMISASPKWANTRVPRRSTGIWDKKIHFDVQLISHIFQIV